MADTSVLYLIGSFVALAGFLVLNRWIMGLMGRGRPATGSVLTTSFALFIAGGLVLATAIVLDTEQYRIENTRLFVYEVSLRPSGDLPLLVRLPAPLDPRFRDAFPQTNGTSTLTIVGASETSYVQAYVAGNASFRVQVQLVGTPLDRALSHASPTRPAGTGNTSTVVTLTVADNGTAVSSVDVVLSVLFDEFCYEATLSLEATAQEGQATYPALWAASEPIC